MSNTNALACHRKITLFFWLVIMTKSNLYVLRLQRRLQPYRVFEVLPIYGPEKLCITSKLFNLIFWYGFFGV